MKKFNINHYIYVQITEAGWKHLRESHDSEYIKHVIESRKVIIGDVTYHKLQCHEAFSLLPMVFGKTPLFNTNILIDEKDLPDNE